MHQPAIGWRIAVDHGQLGLDVQARGVQRPGMTAPSPLIEFMLHLCTTAAPAPPGRGQRRRLGQQHLREGLQDRRGLRVVASRTSSASRPSSSGWRGVNPKSNSAVTSTGACRRRPQPTTRPRASVQLRLAPGHEFARRLLARGQGRQIGAAVVQLGLGVPRRCCSVVKATACSPMTTPNRGSRRPGKSGSVSSGFLLCSGRGQSTKATTRRRGAATGELDREEADHEAGERQRAEVAHLLDDERLLHQDRLVAVPQHLLCRGSAGTSSPSRRRAGPRPPRRCRRGWSRPGPSGAACWRGSCPAARKSGSVIVYAPGRCGSALRVAFVDAAAGGFQRAVQHLDRDLLGQLTRPHVEHEAGAVALERDVGDGRCRCASAGSGASTGALVQRTCRSAPLAPAFAVGQVSLAAGYPERVRPSAGCRYRWRGHHLRPPASGGDSSRLAGVERGGQGRSVGSWCGLPGTGLGPPMVAGEPALNAAADARSRH